MLACSEPVSQLRAATRLRAGQAIAKYQADRRGEQTEFTNVRLDDFVSVEAPAGRNEITATAPLLVARHGGHPR